MTNTKRDAWLPGGAALCTAAVVLLPKCPLCIAAYISLLGVGASFAGVVAQAVRPLLIGAALVAVGLAIGRRVMRRRAARIGPHHRSARGVLRPGSAQRVEQSGCGCAGRASMGH